MKTNEWTRVLLRACAVAALTLLLRAPLCHAQPSFAEFDKRARAGEHLNVVFFGASLTWGANATAPNLTSYRAQTADALRERYPEARFRFFDAAIGGTGSQLGVFRFERDVMQREPDLVFLDFSANDDIHSANPETMASYESLVRRAVREAECPLVIVLFPFKWNIAKGDTEGMKGRDGHLAIAEAYHVPVGDAIVLAQKRVREGAITLEAMYPADAVHPGDRGYAVFADAAMQGFAKGVKDNMICRAPEEMLHADTYMPHTRKRLATLPRLPAGWRKGRPNLTSAWYDALMSRWLDELVIASNRRTQKDPETGKKKAVQQKVASLVLEFQGSMVLVFGEKTRTSGAFRAYIDGHLVVRRRGRDKHRVFRFDANSDKIGGNTHLTCVIQTGLDPGKAHTLEIEPVFDADEQQELRIESVCVAGGEARVWLPDEE